MTTPNRGSAPVANLAYRSYVLTVLVIVYAFNFIDRQIVGILAIPIKADLKLSDTQLGMMGGLAFALFYTLLGIPIARLADRVSRIRIMSIALAVWSLMTAVCGLTTSFGQLFLARLGVGVGEAGGVAPAYSLICDYFPPKQRARALSVYSFGIPIGSAVGIVAGAYLTRLVSWRLAFVVVGIAGVVLTPLLAMSVREPARGGLDVLAAANPADPAAPISRAPPAPTLWQVCATLGRKRSFWGLSLGASFSSMMGYGLFFWLPSLFVRSFGMSLVALCFVSGDRLHRDRAVLFRRWL
jgi:MFS family permease